MIARRAFTLGLIIIVLFAYSAAAQHQQDNPIRAEVNLVTVLVSVLDQHGKPVVDLPRDAFQLFEEGRSQEIAQFEAETSQPLDIALMVDTSLSAIQELKTESEAAAHFIRRIVRPGDRLSVFEFDDYVTQLSGFSDKVAQLQQASRRIVPGDGTALYDAIVLGSQQLAVQPADRRRAIVFVTDAGETTSNAKFEDARNAAITASAQIYTILVRYSPSENLRNTAGEHALDTITDSTGGDMIPVDSPADLDPAFDRVDRELRTQYRLRYYPNPRPPAGSLRHIEIRVNGNYILHYPKNYIAARRPR